MSSQVLKNFLTAVRLELPEEVPTVIWGVAVWYNKKLRVKTIDYYQKSDICLDTQIKLQNQFPDNLLLPGIWPDFGVVAEPSAFGCPVVWDENEAPVAKPAMNSMRHVLTMKKVNVKEDGLLPEVIKRYEYFFNNLPQKYIEDYGYLDGSVFFLGPLETAAAIRGYCEFLFELYDNPTLVHKLLDIVTTTELEYLRYLETKIGKIKRLLLCDHFATQVSPELFEEFVFPYITRIFDEYPTAIKLYHNEGKVDHILSRIPDMGTTIFHFGTEIRKTKELIGDKVCLMGNIDPVRIIRDGTPEQIKEEARRVLQTGAKGGGFILCSAGAFGVHTPDINVNSMLNAVKRYQSDLLLNSNEWTIKT